MAIRRAAGDALVRTTISPLTSLLVPSLRQQQLSRRTFSAASRLCVFPRATATTTTPPKASEGVKESNWSVEAAERSRHRLGGSNISKSTEVAMDGGITEDLLGALNQKRAGRMRSTFFETDKMMTGKGTMGSQGLQVMNSIANLTSMPPRKEREPLRLDAKLGRSVRVAGNVDLGRAIRLLEQSCAKNRVRRDATYQRFHERAGLKRKRLASERWRKRFRIGFLAVVRRVKTLKNQGW